MSLFLSTPKPPFKNPNHKLCKRIITIPTRTRIRIRSSFTDLFKALTLNTIDLLPPLLTSFNYRIPGPDPPTGNYILYTSPTPFNRCVFLRCPTVTFENEGFMNDDRHFLRLNYPIQSDFVEDEVEYQRECVRCEDGGVVAVDWPKGLDIRKECGMDTTVVIVPGTAEGSRGREVKEFVFGVLRSGCFPVVVNPRGCAGSPLTTTRLFTAADSDGICTAIQFVNRLRPWSTLMGVGWGYGANMLTKYLAEVGETTPLAAAVCINNPFDLEEATRSIPHHIALDQKLTGGLIEILRANKELFEGKAKGFDLAKALSATSVRDFDEAISMVSYGFDTVKDFYSMTSTRQTVNRLKVPVLFIQNDDGTVPPFSIPRSSIADNPFTSLLLCSCSPSTVNKSGRSAMLWGQQLAIEWLAAVELALLKGRHPLLKDVDIAINPTKGLAFVNGEESVETASAEDRTCGSYDPSQLFLSGKSANNDTSTELTQANTVNGIPFSPLAHVPKESDDTFHDEVNCHKELGSELHGMQKDDEGISQNSISNASSTDVGGDNPTDTEGSQVLQTATVVMNMLDVTMPGTLDDQQKKKVLTAMEQGETLVKALEGAVPEDVRGNLTTAVTEILQTQGTNLNLDSLKRIRWNPNVTAESRSQEDLKGNSTTESGSNDNSLPDERKNDVESDGSSQDDLTNLSSGNTTTEESIESLQEKVAYASSNVEGGYEVGDRPSKPEKSENAGGGREESSDEQHKVSENNEKSEMHSESGQFDLIDGNDAHISETKTADPAAELNVPNAPTNSEEALAGNLSTSEDQVADKEGNDNQKNEAKNTQNPPDQNAQSSTEPEDSSPQHLSSNSPSISVTQALDALSGFDDTTQMAVNNVFGVIENMIDQFEKSSNQESDAVNNIDEKLVNGLEKTENSNDKSGLESDEFQPSNIPENSSRMKDTETRAGVNDKLDENEVIHSLTSSVNNSVSSTKENDLTVKNLGNKSLNKVGRVQSIPLDVAGKQYWESPYAAYLNKYCPVQLPTIKSLDLDSTTDLFLDPEEGQWKMIDHQGNTKNATGEGGDDQSINGRDQTTHSSSQQSNIENVIEPSYVILDNEYSRFEHQSAEPFDTVNDHQDADKEELTLIIKKSLLDALKIEVSRRLGTSDLKELENSLVYDLDQLTDSVSRAVVHDNEPNLSSFSERNDTTDFVKFGTIDGENIIRAISSAFQDTIYLRKVLPVGVIVGSSLTSLRKYFQVVALSGRDSEKETQLPGHMQENSHGQLSQIKKGISIDEKDQHIGSEIQTSESQKDLQTTNSNKNGIMVGAVTAALGASALLAQHQEKNQNSLVSSLAEKAMSVAGPVVPTTNDGGLDQERLVAILAELGQKGGILRFVGKFALLWGGIRGALSLTERLISFLHIAERPLLQRLLGFVGMVLVLWSPVVIPLIPAILQSWTTKTSNGIVDSACIIGLYAAVMILVMIWGKRIRGYENPLEQYGLDLTSASKVNDFLKGLIGGVMIVLSIHSINVLLGYARFCWPLGLPSSSVDALMLLKAYGGMLALVVRGTVMATGIAIAEELLFRSWFADEIMADLGYYRAILISGLAFSLIQRSLPSIPGFLLLSLALFGVKQRSHGKLFTPIGMRAGIMTANFILQSRGFLMYWPHTPFWLASTHPWHPFEGVVGLSFCAALAIIFYPRAPENKKILRAI